MGKTAASICFVKEAEHFLANLPIAKFAFDVENQHEALRAHAAKVKAGSVVLQDWLTVEQFLQNPPVEE